MDSNEVQKPRSKVGHYLKISSLLLSIFLIGFIILSSLIEVDKVIIEPGAAETVSDKIDFGDTQTFDDEGEIRFLTVLVSSKKPSYFEYWWAKYLKDNVEILPWQEVNGDLSPDESNQINEALMRQSQNTASFVALKSIGCEVEQKGTGAIISEIQKGSPAIVFKKGDVIVEINGEKISLGSQAGEKIREYSIGEEINIVVERGRQKERISKKVKLIESPFEEGISFLGVGLLTRDFELDLPIDITIDPGSVTGPSAGLAFTLSIVDQLTPGDLTGGNIISATGEISLEGNVGSVGGIEQKSIAAKNAKSSLMLVPKGEKIRVSKNLGSMKVVEVENISEALAALENFGGDKLLPLAECPSSE